MVLFIPFPTIFSDSSKYNWGFFFFFFFFFSLNYSSNLGIALGSKSCAYFHARPSIWQIKRAWTPSPTNPNSRTHPFYTPLHQVNMNKVKMMGNNNKGGKLGRNSWDFLRTHGYNMKERFCLGYFKGKRKAKTDKCDRSNAKYVVAYTAKGKT